MAVVAASPFVLNFSDTPIDLPQHGTFVAGRRRRINNDPYGGEGYVWEDIPVPTEVEEDASGLVPEQEDHVSVQDDPGTADVLTQQQSVATRRLDQIKGQIKKHLLDVLPPTLPPTRMVEGFSLDNIHLGGPLLNCPRYSTNLRPQPFCDQEWQNYARNVLLSPQKQQFQANHWSEDHQYLSTEMSAGLHDSLAHQSNLHPPHRLTELSLEPLDNPWSSLMAHGRRKIAAIA